MASNIEDFRNKFYKDIPLPSGLTAQIRCVHQWDLISGDELPMPRGGLPTEADAEAQQLDADAMQYLRRMGDRMIARGTVRPVITDARDEDGEPIFLQGKLHVSELRQEDYAALLMAIRNWCGLTQEDGQAIEAFRDDPLSPTRESVGGAVPLLAE